MGHPILDAIDVRLGIPGIAGLLSDRLTRSELNSLLLELFDRSSAKLSPTELLKLYQHNRLVQPASIDMIALLEEELSTLKFFRDRDFIPIELSPVSQLGSCSVVATVDQKKIISASRNTEVLADATNAIALHIADLKKSGIGRTKSTKFCTVHRHIRTPPVKGKGMTAHFKIGCLVTSGRDEGNFYFERTTIVDHIETLYVLMTAVYGIKKLRFKLQKRNGNPRSGDLFDNVYDHCRRQLPSLSWEAETPSRQNNYYKGIQFKMIVEVGRQELEMADGGFVDWTQQLLGNRKERLLISGFGPELLHRFREEEKKQNPAPGRAL